VAKLVYALDSKSSGLNAHVGSTPTLGTILSLFKIAKFAFHNDKKLGDFVFQQSQKTIVVIAGQNGGAVV
jgi:hypothetical protein